MTEPIPQSTALGFADLGLADAVLEAVREVGYESPSPIQLAAIPPLLEGKDLLGQAQTGTGKTAAFALPLLSRLELKLAQPQLLVDIDDRQRRVAALQSELDRYEAQNLLELEQRRAAVETQLRQEKETLRRLEDRLKRLEQQRGIQPPAKP